MYIFIHRPEWKIVRLEVEPTDTIASIKKAYQSKRSKKNANSKDLFDYYELFFECVPMKDDDTLENFGI